MPDEAEKGREGRSQTSGGGMIGLEIIYIYIYYLYTLEVQDH